MDSNLSNVGHLRSVGVHVFMCSSLEGVVGTLAAKQRGRGGRQAGQGKHYIPPLYLSRLKTRRLETAERRNIGNSRPVKYKRLGVRLPISMALYTRNDYIFNSNKSNGEERQRSRVYRFSSHSI
jgi:hypothetical protein